jgi:hypothetical protein
LDPIAPACVIRVSAMDCYAEQASSLVDARGVGFSPVIFIGTRSSLASPRFFAIYRKIAKLGDRCIW